jgi:hypothetical protein
MLVLMLLLWLVPELNIGLKLLSVELRLVLGAAEANTTVGTTDSGTAAIGSGKLNIGLMLLGLGAGAGCCRTLFWCLCYAGQGQGCGMYICNMRVTIFGVEKSFFYTRCVATETKWTGTKMTDYEREQNERKQNDWLWDVGYGIWGNW